MCNTQSKSKSWILQNFKQRSLGINEYLFGIKALAEQIVKADAVVDKEELALYTMGGLNGELHAFTTANATRMEESGFHISRVYCCHMKIYWLQIQQTFPWCQPI